VSPKNQYERPPATTLCDPSAPVICAATAPGVSLTSLHTARTEITTGSPSDSATRAPGVATGAPPPDAPSHAAAAMMHMIGKSVPAARRMTTRQSGGRA
jgi:hypothetical protein